MGAIVLFDDDCGLCSRSVRFLYRRDPEARLRFAPLASATGARLLAEHALAHEATDTMVLVDGEGRAWTRSSGALRALLHVRAPWPALARVGLLVPRVVRDAVYALVARNRHRWFGTAASCPAPDAGLRARFLE